MPTWENFREVVRVAHERLLVCTPYYSSEGIDFLFDDFRPASRITFWTRLSPTDWASGSADPEALHTLLSLLDDSGICVELGIHQQLHAKAYAADKSLALIGSANLTHGGFGGNLELMIRLQGGDAVHAVNTLEEICTPKLRRLNLAALGEWVVQARPIVESVRNRPTDDAELLAPVQSMLDNLLGYGQKATRDLVSPTLADLKDFADWLKHNENLPGAVILVDHCTNRTHQNRTGHFKQSFFAVRRFFDEYPEWRKVLSEQLDSIPPDRTYQLNPPQLFDDWLQHVDDHATDSGDGYSYSTLRNHLPVVLGGTHSDGGGSSGTTKRMFPLLARYLEEVNA